MIDLGPDFRLLSTLGKGSFATVFKVEKIQTGEVFAVKQPTKRYSTFEAVNQLPEVLSLRALHGHPNVVSLSDVLFDSASGCASFLFEVLDRNVLEILASRQCPFDEITALLFAHQILTVVSFMHARGIFHRDIKPENCMIDTESLVLKLVDFGSVRGPWSSSPMTEYCSTRWYRAPEFILTAGAYTSSVDEWAVGCILFEMLTGAPLFPGNDARDQIERIHAVLGTPSRSVLQRFMRTPGHRVEFKFAPVAGRDLAELVPAAAPATVALLRRLLAYDPSERIAADEALLMDCFAPLRDAEVRWRATDRNRPFPAFVCGDAAILDPPEVELDLSPSSPPPESDVQPSSGTGSARSADSDGARPIETTGSQSFLSDDERPIEMDSAGTIRPGGSQSFRSDDERRIEMDGARSIETAGSQSFLSDDERPIEMDSAGPIRRDGSQSSSSDNERPIEMDGERRSELGGRPFMPDNGRPVGAGRTFVPGGVRAGEGESFTVPADGEGPGLAAPSGRLLEPLIRAFRPWRPAHVAPVAFGGARPPPVRPRPEIHLPRRPRSAVLGND
jgi:renal tumor antigen